MEATSLTPGQVGSTGWLGKQPPTPVAATPPRLHDVSAHMSCAQALLKSWSRPQFTPSQTRYFWNAMKHLNCLVHGNQLELDFWLKPIWPYSPGPPVWKFRLNAEFTWSAADDKRQTKPWRNRGEPTSTVRENKWEVEIDIVKVLLCITYCKFNLIMISISYIIVITSA